MSKSIGMSIVKTRDGATSILRKLGIKPRDYDFFIEQMLDGRLAVQTHKAQAHLAALIADAAPPEPVRKSEPQVRPEPRTKREFSAAPAAKRMGRGRPVDPNSCASVCRELIRAGKSNDEVWAEVQPRFSLKDSQRHYPAWYRYQLRQRGEAV